MKITPVLLVSSALAGSLAAQQTLQFTNPSGLSAEAEFELLNAGSTLSIRLKNTSTSAPAGFGGADQILTTISFDLGQPGIQAGDPAITGGSVATGPTSKSLNFSVQSVGALEDVSGEWGYGNIGATMLYPNLATVNTSHATPFGGANLDGPNGLAGPSGGLVASPPVASIGGQGAIEDEVVIQLQLSSALADLGFLENGARVEFGSDRVFLEEDCDMPPAVVYGSDPGGLNANASLFTNEMPAMGALQFCMEMDDIADACSLSPGAFALVYLSPGTGSAIVPGFGCKPGTPGEVLLDLSSFGLVSQEIWMGPGFPTKHCIQIPPDPTLCSLICTSQGLWVDPNRPVSPFALTNKVDLVIGS